MSSATQNVAKSLSRRSRRPWQLIILAVVILPFFLFFNWHLYIHYAGSGDLAAAIAEADRLDPGWRWEEMQAKLEKIPDEENSALQIVRVVGTEQLPNSGLVPRQWSAWMPGREMEEAEILIKAPNSRLPAGVATLLRREYAKIPQAVATARKLADMPRGRHPSAKKGVELDAIMASISNMRSAANLLLYHSWIECEDGRIDAALESCRGMINVGRSTGDGTLLALLVRMAMSNIAVGQIEHVLGQGVGSDAEMAKLQQLLEKEEQEPVLLTALRGERIYELESVDNFRNGVIDWKIYAEFHVPREAVPRFWRDTGIEFVDAQAKRCFVLYHLGPLPKNAAILLRNYNALVEVFKLPEGKQEHALKQLAARFATEESSYPPLAKDTFSSVNKFVEAQKRSLVHLRCAIVSIAVERYRLANGRWPNSLNDLVPRYLKTVPGDPFLKGPIHYMRVPDGVAIYSAGQDGKDDGSMVNDRWDPEVKNADTIYRLWDVAQRRQPATK